MVKFNNGYYKIEEPADISEVAEDLGKRDSIPVRYNGGMVYPFYALCNVENFGYDTLVIHQIPEELLVHNIEEAINKVGEALKGIVDYIRD